MGDRYAPPAGLSAAEPPGRPRLGVRVDRLPGQPQATPGPTTSSTSNARWRGSRRTSPTTAATPISLRSPAVRRAGTCASLAALTPDDPQWQPGFEDADTSVVAAVPIYGRYDWVSAQGLRAQGVHRVPAEVRGQEAVRREPAGVLRTRRRSIGYAPTRHRFSSCTARTTRSFRCPRAASSPRSFARCRRPPSRTPRSRTPSTRSTSTTARRGRTTPPGGRGVPVLGARQAASRRYGRHRVSRRPSAPRKALRHGGFRRTPRSSRRSARADPTRWRRRTAPRC